jgi:hypothetical protein
VFGLTRVQGNRLGSITPGPGGISSAASTPGFGAQGANSKVPTFPRFWVFLIGLLIVRACRPVFVQQSE